MPDRKPGEPTLGSLMHRLPPSDDRADLRSATPLGFAYAVFHANKHIIDGSRLAPVRTIGDHEDDMTSVPHG